MCLDWKRIKAQHQSSHHFKKQQKEVYHKSQKFKCKRMIKLEIKEIENIQNRDNKVKNWHLEGLTKYKKKKGQM